MIRSLTASVSALTAYGHKMAATANNIANSNTDGFKRSRVDLQEAPADGVRADIRQENTPGPPNPDAKTLPGLPDQLSNVNLTQEIPELIIAGQGYAANLKALEAQDDMIGSLLDIMG